MPHEVVVNGKTVTIGKKRWVPPEIPENLELRMEYGRVQQIVDQDIIGPAQAIMESFLRSEHDTKADREIANRYAALKHPILKVQRCVGWLMKLEELFMKEGNMKAAEMLFDRTFGKVTETIAIGTKDFDNVSDGELLRQLKGIKAQIEEPKPDTQELTE